MDSYYLTPLNTYKLKNTTQNTKNLGSLTIRSAEEKDLKNLTSVLLRSFHPDSGWFYPILRLGVYEDLKSRLYYKLPYYKCLVAIGGGLEEAVVGTIEIALRPVSFFGDCLPYISNLAVSETYRRQGVADSLLGRCEQIVQQWGFKEIWLHVLDDNQAAQHLYLKRGYKIEKIEADFRNIIFNQPKKLLLVKKL